MPIDHACWAARLSNANATLALAACPFYCFELPCSLLQPHTAGLPTARCFRVTSFSAACSCAIGQELILGPPLSPGSQVSALLSGSTTEPSACHA